MCVNAVLFKDGVTANPHIVTTQSTVTAPPSSDLDNLMISQRHFEF